MMNAALRQATEAAVRKVDAGFIRHLQRDHMPYRRDCKACLAGYFRGHVHRRIGVPDGWCLSLDLIGPFKEGDHEDGSTTKYGLVGVLVVPDILDEIRLDFVGPEGDGVEGESEEENLFVEMDAAEGEVEEDYSTKEIAGERAEKAKWEAVAEVEKIDGAGSLEIPFYIPLRDKSGKTVLRAVGEMVMQIHALGMTVRRIHSDRGREFNNDGMKKFCVARSIIKTTTTGDDFKMNGRCESFIGRGKNAVRTLLAAKGLEKRFWSFAFRHHVAKIQNYILEKLGVARPRLPEVLERQRLG